jgi:hypothetical protein
VAQARQLEIASEDLLELLGRAITCAVLGKAGPQRARILANLYKVPALSVKLHATESLFGLCGSECVRTCSSISTRRVGAEY